MQYTIPPFGPLWTDGVFTVPTCVADRYLKLASAYQLQALLLLLRHGGSLSTRELAGALGIPERDADSIMDFWVAEGLLQSGNSPAAPAPAEPSTVQIPVMTKVPPTMGAPANLMLMGQTGLGKTHLSLAIANVAIGRGLSVEYGTAYNILSDLQNENFGRTGNLQYTEERVLHTDLLILDDLGTEYTSAYTVACLYNIINTRILCSRPTVISTNLGFDELAQKYDQRITSRIAGAYSRLVLVGNDIRYIK